MSILPITIYTDGAAIGNPGPGGCAALLLCQKQGKPHRKKMVEKYRYTTNNRMELMAVIHALEMIKTSGHPIEVYSDSKYVVDAVEKGWLAGWIQTDFKKKKNKDLWMRYWTVAQRHKIRLHWVKGHAGIPENETCDQHAEAAARAAQQNPALAKVDIGYENP